MPILGIIASQISGHLASPTSYESIATVTVGSGGQASISFTSIPSTYTHLQIRGVGADGTTNGNSNVYFYANSDTTAGNYYSHYLYGTGSAAGATSAASSVLAFETSYNSTYPGAAIIDILDYTNTNKYKTVRSLSGTDQNGGGVIAFTSCLWKNTSAISSITLTAQDGNWTQYTKFALYGIKGA